jgi:REP element-mobilizing transposase RayT
LEPFVGARIARPSLSVIGKVVRETIENISHIYETVSVDKYVIMPNHIHMIVRIQNPHGRAMRAPTISTVVNQMKGTATKRLGHSIWQKLFHDHVIRNEDEHRRISQYVDENPAKWEDDCFYQEPS